MLLHSPDKVKNYFLNHMAIHHVMDGNILSGLRLSAFHSWGNWNMPVRLWDRAIGRKFSDVTEQLRCRT